MTKKRTIPLLVHCLQGRLGQLEEGTPTIEGGVYSAGGAIRCFARTFCHLPADDFYFLHIRGASLVLDRLKHP